MFLKFRCKREIFFPKFYLFSLKGGDRIWETAPLHCSVPLTPAVTGTLSAYSPAWAVGAHLLEPLLLPPRVGTGSDTATQAQTRDRNVPRGALTAWPNACPLDFLLSFFWGVHVRSWGRLCLSLLLGVVDFSVAVWPPRQRIVRVYLLVITREGHESGRMCELCQLPGRWSLRSVLESEGNWQLLSWAVCHLESLH